MKTTNEIFDNIERKIKIKQTAKNKTIKKILSLATSIILLISIPIIVSVAIFNNTSNPNDVANSNSANHNSANGAGNEYYPIKITYDELLINLNYNQKFSLLIPKKSEKITSISNYCLIEYNKIHWFDVLSNTETTCWNIKYYNFGFEKVHTTYENYSLCEEIEFNGIKGYVASNNHVFKGMIAYVFDCGNGMGIEFVYYGNYNEIVEPISILKKFFIEK